jgi:hypothetical protein
LPWTGRPLIEDISATRCGTDVDSQHVGIEGLAELCSAIRCRHALRS